MIRLTIRENTRPLDWKIPTEDPGVVEITAQFTINGETCSLGGSLWWKRVLQSQKEARGSIKTFI